MLAALSPFRRAAIGALALVPFAAQPAHAQGPPDESVVCMFEARVDPYVQLHRRLEALVPAQVITQDPVRLFASRRALAEEIRRARTVATQGEIFTPEIAALFRRILRLTLDNDRMDWSVFLAEDGMQLPIEVRVNADYPADGPVATMPPTLLEALPPLPRELQYRFVNFDLILWDVHAGLIVDFIPDIFKRTTAP